MYHHPVPRNPQQFPFDRNFDLPEVTSTMHPVQHDAGPEGQLGLGSDNRRESLDLAESSQTSAAQDPKIVGIIERFTRSRFPHPNDQSLETRDESEMRNFISDVLKRSESIDDDAVAYSTLLVLQRVRDRLSFAQLLYPCSQRAERDHTVFKKELFLSAFIISHTYHRESTFKSRHWSKISRFLFSTADIIAMVRRMCVFLQYDFNPGRNFSKFRQLVEKHFSIERPLGYQYPAYLPGLFSNCSNFRRFQSLTLERR